MDLDKLASFHDVTIKKRLDIIFLRQIYGNIYVGYLLVWCMIFGSVASINPQNTAVKSGTQVYLNCSLASASSTEIAWNFIPVNGVQLAIMQGCKNSTTLPQYGGESPTTNSCNLIIYNVNITLAGIYQCTAVNIYGVSAQLIVLESDSKCTTTPTKQVSVDQSVEMSCGTTYSGNMRPVMTWFNSTQNLTSPQVNTSNYAGSTINVRATVPTVPSYTCHTKFNPPTNPLPNYATNAPSYTSQCNTTSLQVLYPPAGGSMNIVINENPNNVSCQDTLSCSAEAFPTPTYTWTLPDGSTATGSTVNVTQTGTDLQYTCTAINSQGAASTFIKLNISYCSATVAGGSTNVGAIIVGVVIGGLAAIGLIALAACFCVKSCPLYQKCRAVKNETKTSSAGTKPIENHGTPTLSDLSACNATVIYEEVETINDYMKLDRGGGHYENGQVHVYASLTSEARGISGTTNYPNSETVQSESHLTTA